MIVVSSDKVQSVETADEIVGQGPVYRKELISSVATGGASILLVTFEPGAKLNYHAHSYEQILIVTEGKGIVGTREEQKTVKPGDVVFFAPNEPHMHGAAADSRFSHIAIQKPGIRLA